jgi:hypothetical protein
MQHDRARSALPSPDVPDNELRSETVDLPGIVANLQVYLLASNLLRPDSNVFQRWADPRLVLESLCCYLVPNSRNLFFYVRIYNDIYNESPR